MKRHAANYRNYLICRPRWDQSQYQPVFAVFAPAADAIVSLLQLLYEHLDVGWIVLQISVHRNYDAAVGMIYPGGQGCGLSEVSNEADQLNAWIFKSDFFQFFKTLVFRAVINQHHFPGSVELFGGIQDLLIEKFDILLFVIHWYHERYAGAIRVRGNRLAGAFRGEGESLRLRTEIDIAACSHLV
jgi:hypothetical protein